VVLAGGGEELFAFAAELQAAGASVAAVVVADESPPALAGIEVLSGAEIVACVGGARFAALVVRDAAGERRIAADFCVLSAGRQPETALARLLGAEIVDAEGRTSVPDVVVIQQETALAAAARMPVADDVIACVCEGVTAGQIRAVGGSPIAAKRATRAGMGACGGRLCAGLVGRLCGVADAAWDTPRAPVRLVPASVILRATDEPHPPVWAAQGPWPAAPVDRDAAPIACDVAVIGGGVVGLSTALFLARAGRDVVLLDRAEAGQGASSANAGSLHVQLLPYTFSDGDPGPLATALLLGPASIALWQELARDANDDLGIRMRGGLMLAQHAGDLDLLARKAAFERSRGVPVEVIDAAEVARISPNLAPVAGAAWCAAEGQIDPLRGTVALLTLARRAGVRVFGGREPQEFAREGAAWRIETAGGPVRAGQVVNCAGPGAVSVARLAGVALPVRTVVQQVIATARAPDQTLPLVAVAGRHLSLKQNYGGQLLIGGGWPGALQPDGRAKVLRASLEGNLQLAASVLPMLAGVDVVRAWAAPTVHLDRGPVLSATPGMPGLWHGVVSNGYTLGPGVGMLMAEAVLGRGALPAEFAL
jgi:glycine/D-amino acid oxidase-like deaminating enzyme